MRKETDSMATLSLSMTEPSELAVAAPKAPKANEQAAAVDAADLVADVQPEPDQQEIAASEDDSQVVEANEGATPPDELSEQLALCDSIVAVEVDIRELGQRQTDFEVRLKQTIEELESAHKARETLLAGLPASLLAIRGISDASLPPVVESQAEPAPTSDTAPATVSDDWQEKPATIACEGIPRLGKGKIAKILDQYPTAGELNEARATAAKNRVHFSTLLPTGIGKDTADAIAEKLIDLEMHGVQIPASEQVKETREETESCEDAAVKRRIRQLTTLAKNIASSSETLDQLENQSNYGLWDDGYELCDHMQSIDQAIAVIVDEHGGEITDDEASDFIRGFLYCERETEHNDAIVAEPEVEVTVNPDDLQSIANEIEDGDDFLWEKDKKAWDAGHTAGTAGKPLAECPLMTVISTYDWIRGWFEAKRFVEL